MTVSSVAMDRRRTREVRRSCFELSKKMTRLLRHDPTVHREHGAVEFSILAPMVSFKIDVFSVLVTSNMAKLFPQKEVVFRKVFSNVWIDTLLTPSYTFEATQGHPGGKHIDPTLQDNVLLPSDFASTSITLEAPMKYTPSSSLD